MLILRDRGSDRRLKPGVETALVPPEDVRAWRSQEGPPPAALEGRVLVGWSETPGASWGQSPGLTVMAEGGRRPSNSIGLFGVKVSSAKPFTVVAGHGGMGWDLEGLQVKQ